jgi:glyoxylase-like metal-dependent hydrolase (beta-lactamase superfamily II)
MTVRPPAYPQQRATWATKDTDFHHGAEGVCVWVACRVTESRSHQNAEPVEWASSFHRNLTFIYVTHGHGDHFFAGRLELYPRRAQRGLPWGGAEQAKSTSPVG